MRLVYLPTFTKKISQIDVNMPYIDPMGYNDPLKMYDTKHTLFSPVRFLDASGLVVLRCQPICIATSSHCILAIFFGVGSCLHLEDTPWKFNIDPENRPSQKETHLPTIIFKGLC